MLLVGRTPVATGPAVCAVIVVLLFMSLMSYSIYRRSSKGACLRLPKLFGLGLEDLLLFLIYFASLAFLSCKSDIIALAARICFGGIFPYQKKY